MNDAISFVRGGWVLAKRELLSLFVTPLGYVVWSLFLLQQGYDFALLLRVLNDPLAAPGPVMQFYFGGSFFIFWLPIIFTCAVIGMRLLAEERRQGTLEALVSAPVSPHQIVLGKFAAALAYYVVLWLPTSAFFVMLRGAAVTPDPGPVWAGYAGVGLVGCTFLAVGLMFSAMTRSQLGAAITTFVVCSLAVMSGLLVDEVGPGALERVLRTTSLLAMMHELAQGVVDLRWCWIHAAATLVALVVATVAVDPRRTWQGFARAALWSVAILGFTVVGVRESPRFDVTRDQVYSLSEQAKQALAALECPVRVTALIPTVQGGGRLNPVATELRELLTRMQAESPRIDVSILDPDRHREAAEQLLHAHGLTGGELAEGVLTFEATPPSESAEDPAGGPGRVRRRHLLASELVVLAVGPDTAAQGARVAEARAEEAIVRTLREVSRARPREACLIAGHGESPLDGLLPYDGHAHFADLLRGQGLRLVERSLREATQGAPEGAASSSGEGAQTLTTCDLVVVAGARAPLSRDEAAQLQAYLDRGGRLLVFHGAHVRDEGTALGATGLEGILERFGLAWGSRVVLDPHTRQGASPLLVFTLVDGVGDHPSLRPLVGRPVSMALARELVLTPRPEVEIEILFEAKETAWAESSLSELGVPSGLRFDETSDRPGPLPLIVTSSRGTGRLTVVASDEILQNAYLREDVAYDHLRELIRHLVGFMTSDEGLYGLPHRSREHVKLVLLPEQLARMTLVCLLGLPAFSVLLGTLVLWRRR